MLRKIAAGVRMTQREYRANIDGLNIFFGAVLGFVLAGSEALTSIWFGFLLGATAGIVISILYIPASNKRVTYSILALILIASMDRWLEPILPGLASIPPKLQPSLAVWALTTIFVEFLPRETDEGKAVTAD